MVSIVTMNVCGLQDNRKRKEMFLYLNKMGYDIILLRETHSQLSDGIVWNSERAGTIGYTHGEANARVVMTMIRTYFSCEVKKTKGC